MVLSKIKDVVDEDTYLFVRVKRTSGNDLVNKAVLCIGIVDPIYAVFVSPFFIENYIDIHWGQSIGYCHFYEYVFSFHDLFVPLLLIALSAYVSLKYSGTCMRRSRNGRTLGKTQRAP